MWMSTDQSDVRFAMDLETFYGILVANAAKLV